MFRVEKKKEILLLELEPNVGTVLKSVGFSVRTDSQKWFEKKVPDRLHSWFCSIEI